MFKFRVGDTVKITSGKDKGREGRTEKIFPKDSLVLIPGINIFKKHVKGGRTTSGSSQKGGIYDIPRPVPIAKISLICPKCKKITRVGFEKRGYAKARICKKCKSAVDTAV